MRRRMPGLILALLLSMPAAAQGPSTQGPSTQGSSTQAPSTQESSTPKPTTQDPAADDLWLEDGASDATRAWVHARNAETEARLLKDPRFAAEQRRFVTLGRQGHSDEYLNGGLLHRVAVDDQHPLGTWQVRAISAAARAWVGGSGWQTLLSLDDLARQEGKPWKFRPGWLNPMCDTTVGPRCVLHLSPDGGDRTVLREFDLHKRRFVADGFRIETPARTYAHWVDKDQLLVASDFGPGTLSHAGYARQSRLWRRGTPLAEAQLLFEAADDAVLFIPHAFRSTTGSVFVAEVWRQAGGAPEWWLLRTEGDAQRLSLPVDVVRYHGVMGIAADRLVLMTAQALVQGDSRWPAGSLVAVPLPGRTGPAELIFAPAADEAVDPIFHLAIADDGLWFGVMKDVSGHLFSARRGKNGWGRREHPVPPFAAIRLLSGEVAPSSVLVKTESLLLPPAVSVRSNHAPTIAVAQAPAAFDASGFVTEQRLATSRDGTRVPYYIVRPKAHRFDGRAAALLTAYGGFGISFLPSYLNSEFQSDFAWPVLAAGGIHVHVNIRGGGEFGPAWHRAAQGRAHPRGIEDLIAVAEDLVRIGAASAQRLGFVGASNGGLLATATAVMRPDLFKAVVADVPITDMLRFHELFTGAVWIDEYGDPRVPEDRAVLQSYSPLHNLREGVHYPEMLLTTSSSDDRVHPGHARRFAERLRRLGQPVLFFESADAGHEGAASLESAARQRAMKSTYLLQALDLTPR
jgi:prolyl oligopeptidase